MSAGRALRGVAPLALAALLAGCFGHEQRSDTDSESFWSTEPEAPAAAPAAAPEYEVQRGDTLIMIAFRRGLDWRELASLNHLGTPYTIYPGQRLQLPAQPVPVVQPASSGVATATEPSAASAEGMGTETYAVRESGPAQVATPSASARPPDATHAKAAHEPSPTGDGEGGSLTRAIRGNQNPTAPAATKAEAPAEPSAKAEPATQPTVPASKPIESAGKATETAAKPVVIASAAPPPQAASPPAPVAATGPARTAGGASWRWPAQGTLVGRFLPGDPARQGINVQGKPGATVTAAADGEVVYSGNGLVGYGELIIVKHNAELLSAYGGSGKRLVTEGSKVRSGQPLAELAGNGIVHFEIRRSGKPVDPLEYLPGR